MPSLPTTRDEAEGWVRNFHRVCDTLEASLLDTVFARDATLQFGNYPVINGVEGIKALLGRQFALLEEMHHKFRYGDVVGDRVYHACTISYLIKGDTKENEIEIPAAAIHHVVTEGEEKGLIKRFEVFIDNAPVVQRMALFAPK
ncbi:hypothetical protein NKR23_g4254 [Pleurostoma richardsiae]|uniref:SnoaL-like domain-containing protein n=1 Tax=Pleurostoma richardsiae TaxID=41990 RepID=A0AA38S502_9PEZI|nr:hypothetical protein NKR23_g4254 [Pleurostoma richardsiae]